MGDLGVMALPPVLPSGIVAPAVNNLLGWSVDPGAVVTTKTPTAATIYLVKIMVPQTITITNLLVSVTTAGTSYTNTQVGLYDSNGTLLSQSAVLATGGTDTFATTGVKTIALAAPQTIVGGPGVFVWAALHMGTNAVTAVILAANGVSGPTGNAGLTAATARLATQTGHATNNLQTIGNLTPASNVITGGANTPQWMGVS